MGDEANVPFLANSFKANAALGERANQADFELLIDGMETLAPLIRTAQLPEISRGEPIEDIGPYGLTFHQYGPIKRNGQITFTILDLKDGRVDDALWSIINEKTYVKARIRRQGEGYSGKGYVMSHCLMMVDPGDVDTSGAATLANRSITLTYSWCERI